MSGAVSGGFSGALARLGLRKPLQRSGAPEALSPAPRRSPGGWFNRSGSAGPRRPALIIASVLGVLAVIAVVTFLGRSAPIVSRDARLKPVDPLPGGLHSTPAQDALATKASDTGAQRAMQAGVSFTPAMAPSQPVQPPPSRVQQPAPAAAPVFRGRPVPATVPAPLQAAFTPQDPPKAIPVAAQVDPAVQQSYDRQLNDLFARWGGRAPRTNVELSPKQEDGADPAEFSGQGRGPSTTRSAPAVTPVSARPLADTGQILIPAGRGVYAHPILAMNSDASSPVVLQADSGPIAGDRMVGTFAKQNERLVVHVSTVIHNGETIGVDGVVTSPETMEAAVASNVDQHYASRFLLPAAAAFVAGLGQAIAQTSNTTAVLSPFGGATTATHLNIQQQLGVAAGAAAAQVGATLNQAAPKGPTVSLEANVAVGVMFLTNVVAHHAE